MNDPQTAADQHQEDLILRDLHQPREQTRIAGERDAGRIDVGLGMRTGHDRAGATFRHQSHRCRDILDGRPSARGQRRSRAEVLAGQGIDGQQLQNAGGRARSIELLNRKILRASLRVGSDDELVADQNDRRTTLTRKFGGRLYRDLRPDAVRIANGQRNGGRRHNGSASSVSMRELSHTTVRSFSFT